MEPSLRRAADEAIGFMPEAEGLALYAAGIHGADFGPLLEIGSYCGKSAIYLGAAAREKGRVLYSIDHHRGSEEHQPGESYHDARLADGTGRVDTFPTFMATIAAAGLTDVVLPLVARSSAIAAVWRQPLGLVFIDGSHSPKAAAADYEGWSTAIRPGGLLAIHDVFPDPAAGGRPPFEIYSRALASGAFTEWSATGSLRVLKRPSARRGGRAR